MTETRKRRRRSHKTKITVPLEHYQQLQRESAAARNAFDALNDRSVSHEDLSHVVWSLWRALEGGIPTDLQ